MLSQADSLLELLNHLHTGGIIKLTKDSSIQPHGISRIDVADPDAFRRYTTHCSRSNINPSESSPLYNSSMTRLTRNRSARLSWFQRADIAAAADEGTTEHGVQGRELENSVNQAFRRWLAVAPSPHH